jgi:hypothetical protein
MIDATLRHLGPLLERWRADGRVHPDLDPRETVRWIIAIGLMLLGPPWRSRSAPARAEAVERYFVRALITS